MTERRPGLLPPPPRLPRRAEKNDAPTIPPLDASTPSKSIDARQVAALISIFESLTPRQRDGFTALCDAYRELDEAERADLDFFVVALRAGLPTPFREKVIAAVRLVYEKRNPKG